MQVFSFEICKICGNTFYAKHHPGLLVIIAVSIVVQGELANETVNYHTETKAYVPISAGSVIKTGSPGQRTDSRKGRSQTSNRMFLKVSQIPPENI